MARFMVEGMLKHPHTPETLALIPAESARGEELDRQGVRTGLFVAADFSKAWQVYRLDSADELDRVLASFPLHPHLRYTITALTDPPPGA